MRWQPFNRKAICVGQINKFLNRIDDALMRLHSNATGWPTVQRSNVSNHPIQPIAYVLSLENQTWFASAKLLRRFYAHTPRPRPRTRAWQARQPRLTVFRKWNSQNMYHRHHRFPYLIHFVRCCAATTATAAATTITAVNYYYYYYSGVYQEPFPEPEICTRPHCSKFYCVRQIK